MAKDIYRLHILTGAKNDTMKANYFKTKYTNLEHVTKLASRMIQSNPYMEIELLKIDRIIKAAPIRVNIKKV